MRTLKQVRNRAGVAAIGAVAALVVTAVPASAAVPTFSPTPITGTYGVNATAYAVKVTPGAVFVGGNFTAAVRANSPSVPRNRVVALSRAGAVLPFVADTDGIVRAFAVAGNDLYLGGDFTTVNGKNRSRVAKVDLTTGEVDLGFNVTVGKPVRDLLVIGDSLYMVGDFTNVNGTARKRGAAVDRFTGGLLGFNPNLSAKAYALAANSSTLFIGGNFQTAGGVPHPYLAGFPLGSSTPTGAVYNNLNDVVLDVTATDSQVYVAAGGGFNSAAGWAVGGGRMLFRHRADGDVQAVTYFGGNLYFGFHDGFGGNTQLRLLAVDVATGQLELGAFAPVSGGYPGVLALDNDGTDLVAAGKFSRMGGIKLANVSIHP